MLQLDASQPHASYEGGQQRCFQTAFFCGRNFPLDAGLSAEDEAALSAKQAAAALAQRVPIEPYSFGQAVAMFKQQQLTQQQRGGNKLYAGPSDAISMQAAAAAAAGGPQFAAVAPAAERARTTGRLRVLFMRRGSEGRQILNAAELLRRCNAWRHEAPGGGPAVTAECFEVSPPVGLGPGRREASLTRELRTSTLPPYCQPRCLSAHLCPCHGAAWLCLQHNLHAGQ